MAEGRKRRDSRLAVARYQVDKLTPSDNSASEDREPQTAGQQTMDARTQYVEIAIEQALRRGDFDDLPGAGTPLTHMNDIHDPNWWIRQKIEREHLTGLGPPALTLRTENAELDDTLAELSSEARVREVVEDFNHRVIEARRQLLGGPPVVTATRDPDAEIERWRERRATDRLAREADRAAEAKRERPLFRELVRRAVNEIGRREGTGPAAR